MAVVWRIAKFIAGVAVGAIIFGCMCAAVGAVIIFGLTWLGQGDLLVSLERQAVTGVEEVKPDVLLAVFDEALGGSKESDNSGSAFDLNSLPYVAFHTGPPEVDLKKLHYWAQDMPWFWLKPLVAFADTICYLVAAFSWFGAVFGISAIFVGVLVTNVLLAIGGMVLRAFCPRCDLHYLAKLTVVAIGAVIFGSMTAGLVHWLMIIGHVIQPDVPVPFTALLFGTSGLGLTGSLATYAAMEFAHIERSQA